MEFRKLTGGRVIGTSPERLQIPLRADQPKVRVGTPGSLFGNVGLYVQMSECSRLQFGVPEPTMVKVVFREIDGQVYLLLGCARAPHHSGAEAALRRGQNHAAHRPVVRG